MAQGTLGNKPHDARLCSAWEIRARPRLSNIGVVMELENTGLVETLNMPIWPVNPFIYIGKSQRNLELRVQYFRGAQLKK